MDDTIRYAVYDPPNEDLPYLAVGMIGDSVECLLAASSRLAALEKLDLEMEILRTKSRLLEQYALDQSAVYATEDSEPTPVPTPS